jgi:hypothetical protein
MEEHRSAETNGKYSAHMAKSEFKKTQVNSMQVLY